MDTKPFTPSQLLHFVLDFLSAIFGAYQHIVRLQFFRVILHTGKRYVGSAEKPVSPRVSICLGVPERKAQRLAAKQRYDPADGSNEMQPRRASPIHGLGPGDFLDRPRQELLQY